MYLILEGGIVEELVDLLEDADAGVAQRTLLLRRHDPREHPPHHVDLAAGVVSDAAMSGWAFFPRQPGQYGCKSAAQDKIGFWVLLKCL